MAAANELIGLIDLSEPLFTLTPPPPPPAAVRNRKFVQKQNIYSWDWDCGVMAQLRVLGYEIPP